MQPIICSSSPKDSGQKRNSNACRRDVCGESEYTQHKHDTVLHAFVVVVWRPAFGSRTWAHTRMLIDMQTHCILLNDVLEHVSECVHFAYRVFFANQRVGHIMQTEVCSAANRWPKSMNLDTLKSPANRGHCTWTYSLNNVLYIVFMCVMYSVFKTFYCDLSATNKWDLKVEISKCTQTHWRK